MTGKTHLIGGATASAAYVAITNHPDPISIFGAGLAGAVIPDICHGGSKIGRKFPILSKIINIIFGHRTFTHSLIFLVLATLPLWIFLNSAIAIGFLIGVASHLILDAATHSGIELFYPWKEKIRFPITIRTGGIAEYFVFAVLAIGTMYFGMDVLNQHFL